MHKKKLVSPIAYKVYQFLSKRFDFSSPLLLAFSKGPDSLALFFALKELQQDLCPNLCFDIAHVNHNWRESSVKEAEEIEAFSKQNNIKSHVYHINNESFKGNLENECRKIRHAFFAKLQKKHGYKAILMGHQKNDQVETVLKRFFEGSFHNLSGILPESLLDGILCWRPLLDLPKQDLLDYCERFQEKAIEDPSNKNEHFLRVRFRQKILPFLEEHFGKSIEDNVLSIASDVKDLQDLLKSAAQAQIERIEHLQIGSLLYLPKDLNRLVIKQVMREMLSGQTINREQLDQACSYIQEAKAHKILSLASDKQVLFDRGFMFITNSNLDLLLIEPQPISNLKEVSSWEELGKPSKAKNRKFWQTLLDGYIFIGDQKPSGMVCSFYYLDDPGERKKLKKELSNTKCPQWLWDYIPVYCDKDRGPSLLICSDNKAVFCCLRLKARKILKAN